MSTCTGRAVPGRTARASRGGTGRPHHPVMDVYRRLINRDLPRQERACTSKVPFATRVEARALAHGGRRANGALQPYRCPYGEHWHLGHRPRRHGRPLPPRGADEAGPQRLTDDGLAWLGREWWADRRRRHLRPRSDDHPWREAWAA